MFGNKNSHLLLVALVLSSALAFAAQAGAAANNPGKKSYFSSTNTSDKAAKSQDPQLNNDLVYRVAFGRAQDVQILLDKNADPNTINSAKIPVLLIATIRKDDDAPKIVKSLLKAGANINIVGPDGNMPITETVNKGRADILQILIDNKAVLGEVRNAQGQDLMTIAENRADPEIISVLDAGLEREKDQIEALKSPDNFIRLVQQYAYLSCAGEYLNFYLTSEPEKVDAVKFDKIITQNGQDIESTGRKIKFIFKMGDGELLGINQNARQQIIWKLQDYQTNANRDFNGVGTDEDLNKKCLAIAQKLNARNLNQDQYKLNTQ